MKTKINFLLENGLNKKTISRLTESQINVLVEKFKKFEEKEAVTKTMTTTTYSKAEVDSMKSKEGGVPVEGNGKVTNNADGSMTITKGEQTEDYLSGVEGLDPDQDAPQKGPSDNDGYNDYPDAMPTESVIKEKFESKAQQNFFWAKCNTSKGVKKKKWCEMAREFSDSTSKKQYKTMPEKKHPEKTVKYKKKETNENLQDFTENTIVEMLEKKVDARMTKKDLIEAIKKTKKEDESFMLRKPKKVTMFSDEAPMELPIGKIFSIGKSKK